MIICHSCKGGKKRKAKRRKREAMQRTAWNSLEEIGNSSGSADNGKKVKKI